LGALSLCLRDSPLTLLHLTADNIHPTINRIKTLSNEEKDFTDMTLQMNPAQRARCGHAGSIVVIVTGTAAECALVVGKEGFWGGVRELGERV
jgi:hypothetical protein